MCRHRGFLTFAMETCGDSNSLCNPPVHLWYARMHYMARFIDLGLNPMYMDTDVTVQSNIYKHVPPPFRTFYSGHLDTLNP
jgi:hypothetical protein